MSQGARILLWTTRTTSVPARPLSESILFAMCSENRPLKLEHIPCDVCTAIRHAAAMLQLADTMGQRRGLPTEGYNFSYES